MQLLTAEQYLNSSATQANQLGSSWEEMLNRGIPDLNPDLRMCQESWIAGFAGTSFDECEELFRLELQRCGIAKARSCLSDDQNDRLQLALTFLASKPDSMVAASNFVASLYAENRLRLECWRDLLTFLANNHDQPDVLKLQTFAILQKHIASGHLHGPNSAYSLPGELVHFGFAVDGQFLKKYFDITELDRLNESTASPQQMDAALRAIQNPSMPIDKEFPSRPCAFLSFDDRNPTDLANFSRERLALSDATPLHVRLPIAGIPGASQYIPTVVEGFQNDWKRPLFFFPNNKENEHFGRTRPADLNLEGVPEIVTPMAVVMEKLKSPATFQHATFVS